MRWAYRVTGGQGVGLHKMFHTSISTSYCDKSVSRIEAERHPSVTHSRTSQSNIHIQNIHYQKSRINKFEMRVSGQECFKMNFLWRSIYKNTAEQKIIIGFRLHWSKTDWSGSQAFINDLEPSSSPKKMLLAACGVKSSILQQCNVSNTWRWCFSPVDLHTSFLSTMLILVFPIYLQTTFWH